MKYCKKCKHYQEVIIIEAEKEKPASWLIRILSPGTKVLERKYQCIQCHSEIPDINNFSGFLLPLIMAGLILGAVAFFFLLVFNDII